MNNIDSLRPSFFPNNKSNGIKNSSTINIGKIKRNSFERANELKKLTKDDANVKIGAKVKDFSRIKKAALAAPEIDNSAKIASLKAQIQGGTYKVDYDSLADKLLQTEL